MHEWNITQLAPVLSSIRDAIVVTDPEGRVTYANPAVEIVTGYPPHELVGREIGQCLPLSCAKEDVSHFFVDALAGDRAVAAPPESFVAHKQGRSVAVDATATPLYAAGGALAGVVFTLHDMTEEARLKRRQYEFLSFVSHQLREPLGGLRWGLEVLMLDKERLTESERDILNSLYGVVLRFLNLVNGLISIARLERGEIALERKPVDLFAAVSQSVTDLAWLATSQNVSVTFSREGDKGGEKLMVPGDRARLADVWNNLIANAIRYNLPRGSVTVAVSRTNENEIMRLAEGTVSRDRTRSFFEDARRGKEGVFWALVSVADSGLGIPASEQSKLFEGFARGKNVVEKGLQGSGLGLFIVKSIVDASGGHVFFRSIEGKGTTFFVVLPQER